MLAAGLAHAVLVLLCAGHHQPWFDEAQSWLLARDLSPAQLIFHQTSYEGTPALWTTLLMPFVKGGLPYAGFSYVSAAIAIIGVAVFLRWAPLPLWLKLLFPFTYFPLFQFAVIARSYALFLPVLGGLAALFPRRHGQHWFGYLLLLTMLTNISLHGALLGVVLFAEWFWTSPRTRTTYFYAVSSVLLYALVFSQLRLPADLLPQFGPHGPAVMALRFQQQIREAYFGGLGSNLWKLSGLFAAIAVIGISARRFARTGLIWLYVGLNAPLLALALFKATYWHSGILFLVWVFCLWLSFDREKRASKTVEYAIGAVFAVQAIFGVYSIAHQISSTYSGAEAAAHYLKGTGEYRDRLFAIGFKAFALQPYFTNNIFAAQEHGRTDAFYAWSKGFDHDGLQDIDQQRPDRVVVGIAEPKQLELVPELRNHGYCTERVFEGAVWWKNGVLEPDTYLVFHRCPV